MEEEKQNHKEEYGTYCAMLIYVGLDGKWKTPAGCDLTSHATAEQQANFILENLTLAHRY